MERGAEPPLHAALCTLDLSPDFVEPRAPVCSGWPYNAPVLERFDARTDGRARLSVALSFVWCFAAPVQRPLQCQKLWELCWCQFGSIVVNRYAKTGTLPLPDYLLRRRGEWKKFSRIKIVSPKDKMKKKMKEISHVQTWGEIVRVSSLTGVRSGRDYNFRFRIVQL